MTIPFRWTTNTMAVSTLRCYRYILLVARVQGYLTRLMLRDTVVLLRYRRRCQNRGCKSMLGCVQAKDAGSLTRQSNFVRSTERQYLYDHWSFNTSQRFLGRHSIRERRVCVMYGSFSLSSASGLVRLHEVSWLRQRAAGELRSSLEDLR